MTMLKELKLTYPGPFPDIGDCLYMEKVKKRLCLAAAWNINVLGGVFLKFSDST